MSKEWIECTVFPCKTKSRETSAAQKYLQKKISKHAKSNAYENDKRVVTYVEVSAKLWYCHNHRLELTVSDTTAFDDTQPISQLAYHRIWVQL